MITGVFEKGALPGLQNSIRFHSRRHDVIAQNVANVETPGYKAKDIDKGAFQEKMGEAFQEMEEQSVRTLDTPEDVDFSSDTQPEIAEPNTLDAENTGILRHDQNNVSVDKEMVKLAKNSGKHMMYSEMLRQQMSMLESAIQTRA